ncbi:MAG: glycosyltransferase [Pseudomonadota bacterium]
MPRISIGIPVYNGASMLPEALEGIRTQTEADISVIMSDNASTDQTAAIMAEMTARDSRFHQITQNENIGPIRNFRAVLEAADAPYFAWRAYDDLSDPAYFQRLADRLDQDPNAVLAAPHVETLNISTGKRRPRPVDHLQARQYSPAKTLARSQAGWVYGLWRTDYLRECFDWMQRVYAPEVWAWDHVILFPAICAGRVTYENAAKLTLRLERVASTVDTPPLKPDLRRLAHRFQTALFDEIDRQGLSGTARMSLRWAVRRHIHRRVVSRWKLL